MEKEKHGHCNVSYESQEYRALGIWVFGCKLSKKKGRIKEWLVDELDAMGFQW
ncbi:MAG: hypothetical protein CMI52_01210 [Parcubacteria group bacterium]|nr:hypothetical protein [Parcubacteria group bacterium]